MSILIRGNPEPGLISVSFDLVDAVYKSYNEEEDINETKRLDVNMAMAMIYNYLEKYKTSAKVSDSIMMTECPIIMGDVDRSIIFPLGLISNLEVDLESVGRMIKFYCNMYLYDDLIAFLVESGIFKEAVLLISHIEDNKYMDISRNNFKYEKTEGNNQKVNAYTLYEEAAGRVGHTDQYLCIHGLFLNIHTFEDDIREYHVESIVNPGEKTIHKIKTACRGFDLGNVLNKITTVVGSKDGE